MLQELAKLIWTRASEHILIEDISMLLKKSFAVFISALQLIGSLVFGTSITPYGEPLNLQGYECVFYDEFEDDELDLDKWFHRAEGSRRGGFNSSDAVTVEDGALKIKSYYDENGKYGAGWYAGMIALKEKYTRGYFEIKCICNDDTDFWSAFWLQADAPYNPAISQGGIGGCEIDIFESLNNGDWKLHNSVGINIHCSGMKGDTSGELNSLHLGNFNGNNIYEEYNTYGLKWTEEEYIFYINGIEAARSSWADGVSQVPEQVVVSLEIPSELENKDKSKTSEFIVDHVKIYQLPQDIVVK